MPYQHESNLEFTYNPDRGYMHFVLYFETGDHGPGSAINSTRSFEVTDSCYVTEWVDRLRSCKANALHVSLVSDDEAPNLWDQCVYTDPKSPAAIVEDGCVCWQTFYDPLTLLPIAKHHFRTVTGNIETWTYWTFAPLALPEGERLEKLVIDREAQMLWVRTANGVLHILPEKIGRGYSVGYSGGGPSELARLIEKISATDGYDLSPGTNGITASSRVLTWATSEAANATQEISLSQLQRLCRR